MTERTPDSRFKVLLLGSDLGYNLNYFAFMALRRAGCDVRFVGYQEFLGRWATPVRMLVTRSKTAKRVAFPLAFRRFNESAARVAMDFRPQLVLAIKGEALLPKIVDWFAERLGATTALWYPDDPRYFHTVAEALAPRFDFIFTAAEKSIPNYKDAGATNVSHLPFGCDSEMHRRVSLATEERKLFASEVCFVGTFSPRRLKIIRKLERSGIKVRVWGPYWNYFTRGKSEGMAFGPKMVKIFNAARIVLNIHDNSDLAYKPNMRVFEATGCGSFLVSDKAFSLQKYFEFDKEVVCYNDESELVNILRHYRQLPDKCDSISNRALGRAHRDHTYDHRLGTLLKTVS